MRAKGGTLYRIPGKSEPYGPPFQPPPQPRRIVESWEPEVHLETPISERNPWRKKSEGHQRFMRSVEMSLDYFLATSAEVAGMRAEEGGDEMLRGLEVVGDLDRTGGHSSGSTSNTAVSAVLPQPQPPPPAECTETLVFHARLL